MQRKLLVPLFGLLALCVLGSTVVGDDAVKEKKDKKEKKSKVDPKAVARARKTVKMLDDIYKSTIVLVTDKYVNKKEDYPAGLCRHRPVQADLEQGRTRGAAD